MSGRELEFLADPCHWIQWGLTSLKERVFALGSVAILSVSFGKASFKIAALIGT